MTLPGNFKILSITSAPAPAGFQYLVIVFDLQRYSWAGEGHAARSYSWIKPPRTFRRRIRAVARPVTAAVTMLLAVIGVAVVAAVSYEHADALVRAHRETGWTARLIPLTVDGLIYATSMVVPHTARRRKAVQASAEAPGRLGTPKKPPPRICLGRGPARRGRHGTRRHTAGLRARDA